MLKLCQLMLRSLLLCWMLVTLPLWVTLPLPAVICAPLGAA